MKLAALLSEIEQKANTVKLLFDRADDEHDGAMPDNDRADVIKLNMEIEQLEVKADQVKQDDKIRAQNEARVAQYSAAGDRPRHGNGGHPSNDDDGKGGHPRAGSKVTSYGRLLIADDQYTAWWKTIAPHGKIEGKVGFQFTSPAVDIPGFGVKDLITGASNTSAGALVFPDIQAGIDLLGRRPLNIRDIITIGQTTSDTIEYVQEVSETNNAAIVGEATATSGSSGMAPESALALQSVQTPVKSVQHWIPATTRALSDAGQISTLIDNFLTFGLQEALENQIVGGNGAGDNFTGIENTSGIQLQAFDSDILTTLRKARTKVRTVGRTAPTAYLMHPNDWEAVDLLKDNENRYFFGGPSVLGTPRIWGLPVVENESVTESRPIVGNFRTVVVWDREQASIQSSNAHADFFLRGLVAILAQLRAGMGVIRPVALVRTDITP